MSSLNVRGETLWSSTRALSLSSPLTPFVRTFQIQQNSTGFSPWLVYPASDRTVWAVTLHFGKNSNQAQIVNFTLGVGPKTVATLANTVPSDIVYDNVTSDTTRRVWILENDSLAYYDPTVRNINIAQTFPGGTPSYLTIDRQDRFWMTLLGTNQIVELVLGARPLYFNITDSCIQMSIGCGLQGITIDPRDGSIWFAEAYAGRIGHLIPCNTPASCSLTYYAPPSSLDLLGLIQVATSGNNIVWFTVHDGNEFGSLNTSTGDWKIYPIGYCSDKYVGGCYAGLPNAIATDSQGQVWFSEHYAGRIARYEPDNGDLVEYMMPTTSAVCANACTPLSWWMWPGQSNLVWFVAYGLGEIGYVNASVPIPLTVSSVVSVSIAQGASAALPILSTYSGETPRLNVSATLWDTLSDPPMLSWTMNQQEAAANSQSETSTVRISAAWSSSLESRYVAVTAYDENLTVNAFVRVDVTASLRAYSTIALVGGISALSAVAAGSSRYSMRKRTVRRTVKTDLPLEGALEKWSLRLVLSR